MSCSPSSPAAAHSEYSSGEAWPFEKISLSLLGCRGLSGKYRNCPPNISPTIRSAADSADVGCPEPACVVEMRM